MPRAAAAGTRALFAQMHILEYLQGIMGCTTCNGMLGHTFRDVAGKHASTQSLLSPPDARAGPSSVAEDAGASCSPRILPAAADEVGSNHMTG